MINLTKYKSEEEWLDGRKGIITGTKVGSLLSKRDKKPLRGFFELIAEDIAIPHDGENYMDRGKRLEVQALERFEEITGKKVNKDLVLITRKDNPKIGYSPDGLIGKTEDAEAKCLNSALHIEAWYKREVPNDYREQMIQGFVVNDKLKKRYMIFYDPRMPMDFFYIEINRKDVKEEIKAQLEMQLEVLKMVEELKSKLTF